MANTITGTPTQLQFDSGTGQAIIYPETITESVLIEDENLQKLLAVDTEKDEEDKNLMKGLTNLSNNKRLIAVTISDTRPESPVAGDVWYEILKT